MKYDNCKDCHGGCEHAGKDREFVCPKGVSCKVVKPVVCERCKDSAEMIITVINKLKDGVTSGWLGGNLPARFCPFCGRKLKGE